MQSSQQLCERPCAHRTISPHVDARSAVAAAVESFWFSAADKSAEIILFVLAGSTMRAEAILAFMYSRARHTVTRKGFRQVPRQRFDDHQLQKKRGKVEMLLIAP